MGNPHKKLKYVHVAGTNGKGSDYVAFHQHAFLWRPVYRDGNVYTSPYIQRFTERIRVDSDEIRPEELAGNHRLCEIQSVEQDVEMRKPSDGI
ncbi:MAG: hypothetical protein QM757_01045 [Paludibaculum sp.]